jgi:1,4-dihydroxy-2-naphthoate octaprenyltransferase
VLLYAPFALALLLALQERRPWLLAPLVLLPWAVRLALRVRREPAGAGLNAVLAATASLGLAFALLLTLGAELAR